MKAQVISLKSDAVRRKKISNLLTSCAYDFEFYEAIEPANSFDYSQELNIPISNSSIGPGEIACALSHSYNLRSFKESGYIFILEDDVIPLIENPFKHDYPADLKDGEILLLALTIKHEWIAYRKQKNKLGIKCLLLDIFSIPMLRGACAYIVNSNTAKAMINVQNHNIVVADSWKTFYSKKAISSFYYAELFLHPDDFTNSNLEAERAMSFPNKTLRRRALKRTAMIIFKTIRFLTGAKYISLPRKLYK